ncbi:hypothetical protein B0J11DRAFT_616133 [Dendryphion nanum]|uniref:Uncharacterized protein n=1 Tax=Dendryphion nanum TaxID=256645 RepID=A0A9P9IHZ4_9PLEO|nr:hypothetical protein B0J11DRAFT_616133 [Dendryphion nanum]
MCTTQDDLEIPEFGQCAFDHFIMEKWDASSQLTRSEQHRFLVASWLNLGIYGRNVYFQHMINTWDGAVPENVPKDLLSDDDRITNIGSSNVAWIRTWYGNEGKGLEDGETITRSSADESYRRLYRRAILCLDEGQDESDLAEPNEIPIGRHDCHDDDPEALGMAESNSDEEIVTPGEIPLFALSMFMKVPDTLDGLSMSSFWRDDDEEAKKEMKEQLPLRQHFLLFVADREACERGWVLQVALNHKGQVLPYRVRGRAAWTKNHVVHWIAMGRNLDATDEQEDTIVYSADGQVYAETGNGWD